MEVVAFLACSFPMGWNWPQTIIPETLRFRPHTFASQKHTVRQQSIAKFQSYHIIQKCHPYNTSQWEKKSGIFEHWTFFRCPRLWLHLNLMCLPAVPKGNNRAKRKSMQRKLGGTHTSPSPCLIIGWSCAVHLQIDWWAKPAAKTLSELLHGSWIRRKWHVHLSLHM